MPATIPYEWSQTATHLCVVLRIPHLKGASREVQRNKSLSIVLASCYLRVCYPPSLLELDLFGDVAFRAASISRGVETINILVPKAQEGLWDSIAAVSNPLLTPCRTEERRRVALADYAEWQKQQQQQRIDEQQSRKEQQQQHSWRQQKEQREWQQQQKDKQVQQVLQQLQGETDIAANTGGKPAAAEKPSASEVSVGLWKCDVPARGPDGLPSLLDIRQQSHKDSPGSRSRESSGDSKIASQQQELAENTPEMPSPSNTGPAAPSALLEGGFETKSGAAGSSLQEQVGSFENSLRRDGACESAQATAPARPCRTINVSFGARRPNRVPARGPRGPPVPHSDTTLSSGMGHREKQGDLARLQQNSPRWLHAKATRLLVGGDAVAACETYSMVIQLKQHRQDRLSVIKALCGRSLACLAKGENQQALADCTDGLALIRESLQQEDAAALAAGQLKMHGIQQMEIYHLQHVLLARRAAAFLRIDSLEEYALGLLPKKAVKVSKEQQKTGVYKKAKAAKSLEELLQLLEPHEEDAETRCCGAADRAAVAADLSQICRLQRMRTGKEEADAVLALALKVAKGRPVENTAPNQPENVNSPQDVGALAARCRSAEKQSQVHLLLHRSMEMYVQQLNDLLLEGRPSNVEASQLPAQQSTVQNYAPRLEVHTRATLPPEELEFGPSDASSVLATNADAGGSAEATAAAARMVAGRLEAALQTASSGSKSLPCAAAAATVLANMALALLHLGSNSSTVAAATVAAAADALLQHVEQQRELQGVEINRLSSKIYQPQTPELQGGHESDQEQPKREDNPRLVSTNLHKYSSQNRQLAHKPAGNLGGCDDGAGHRRVAQANKKESVRSLRPSKHKRSRKEPTEDRGFERALTREALAKSRLAASTAPPPSRKEDARADARECDSKS